MLREVRQFNVWDGVGRLFVLIESGVFAEDSQGPKVKVGASRYQTLTGAEAVPIANGFYRIPSCGVTVAEVQPA